MTLSFHSLFLQSLKPHLYEWDSNIRVSKVPLIYDMIGIFESLDYGPIHFMTS